MNRPLTGYPDQATVDLARATARAAGFDAIAEVITELRRRLVAAEDALATAVSPTPRERNEEGRR